MSFIPLDDKSCFNPLGQIGFKLQQYVRGLGRPKSWKDLYCLFEHFYDPQLSDEARHRCLSVMLNELPTMRQLSNDNIVSMTTSGYTTGSPCPFQWGPDFNHFHEFFSHLVVAEAGVAVPDDARLISICSYFFHLSDGGESRFEQMHTYPSHVGLMYNFFTPSTVKDAIRKGCESTGFLPPYNLMISPVLLKILLELDILTNVLPPIEYHLFSSYERLDDDFTNQLKSRQYKYFDVMRCWDGGLTFYTCFCGKRHWIDMLASFSCDEEGYARVHDLWNTAHQFSSYRTGDIFTLPGDFKSYELCQCGRMRLKYEGTIDRGPKQIEVNNGRNLVELTQLRKAVQEAAGNPSVIQLEIFITHVAVRCSQPLKLYQIKDLSKLLGTFVICENSFRFVRGKIPFILGVTWFLYPSDALN